VVAAGAQRAVVSAVALEDPDSLRRACARYPQRIAGSLDARRGNTDGRATVSGDVPMDDAVRGFGKAGVAQLNYTDVTRDGTMRGPDLNGLARVASMTEVPVAAAGGISSLDDLRAVPRLSGAGVRGAVVGRALYEGKFSLREAMRAADAAASGRERVESDRKR
jgi:phosphoribosylformimino-5-aminoimidazole carboxamide ribonucleotide (ProFAR) isomerase